jgi:hypothetical protein
MSREADGKLVEQLLRDALLGRRIEAIETPAAGMWDFRFGDAHLNVGAPWRIMDGDSIRLGSCDHEQKFGLPEPVDARAVAMELLEGKAVGQVSVSPRTADLEVAFEHGCSLFVFNHSSGYEGWGIASDAGVQVIALGGGSLAIFGAKTDKDK